LTGILAAQFLYLAIGIGLLPLLRIAPTPRLLLARLGLSYMVGVAATGILAAHLALLDVPLGLLELSILAAISLLLGWRRLRGTVREERPRLPRDRLAQASALVGAGTGAAALVLLVHAGRAYAVRPLKEWDGWAIWGMKARALYEFGGTYAPVFTTYQPVAHPLFLPSLEAMDFRAIGVFDGTLVHVQLIALAFGFAAALWGLLAERVPAAVLGLTLLAILSASAVLEQLSTNLADIPLAFLVALAVAALGRYLLSGEGWTLVCAGLFLGAAMLTKSEGTLFWGAAIGALVLALAIGERRRIPAAALAGLGALAILVPWRAYLAAHDLKNPEYSLSDLLRPGYLSDHSDRVSPAASELWHQVWAGHWGLLVPLALVSIGAALVARRYRLAAFAALWPALAFLGMVLVYWISVVPVKLTLLWTADRIVASLVIGSAALAPLLVAEAWRAAQTAAIPRSGSQSTQSSAAEMVTRKKRKKPS
jgi:hypothetical protein